ncbi:carbohydrate ABC transporter substrate-binding protein [Cellulomonas sp. zg-ZUI222]|uniref:Carbohydrate ABC transporter substrate-binding protein n=1 Tax=Cellulomonas wangleii TaxID=2816956 RepID=A0ABX8D2Z8_9CELL|nr:MULTISPECIES: ABC transporter substrate-binding protein [Cellulomonas]MBO0899227.1 carbohydrate ABC transporter substrate-binding protein [Cellulomonas sp. zg-ZUI22]MBO0920077.1 carbohydrate ABC transporter substrate-binding protein [Cellulomonas wangleii]MBO0923494.1 carbohydrate ABC transporter substrate-binding protein [Cellulomonas wangleii]QVI61836.1 carbohydrate ABC transporter substrate-binding protein [Cellulomonas wangleii]
MRTPRTRRGLRPAGLTAGLLAAALALTACAQGGSADTGGSATSDAADPDEPVTIRWSWWGSDTRHTLTQEVIDLFEQKNPTITVVPDYTDWGSYFDKLSVSVAGGDAPDVITQEERYLADYAAKGVLADLSALDVDTSKIDDTILQSGTIDDAVYGIATGVNVYSVVADPQAFADAGVEMPDDTTWTWEDYVEIANEITEKSGGAVYGAQDYGFNEPGFSILARQNGQSLYDEDGALGFEPELLAQWWQHSLDMQAAGGQPEAAKTVEVDAGGPEQSLVGTNTGAMAWFWSNQLTALSNASGRPLQLLRVPGESQFDRTGMYFKPAMYYSVSSKSKHPEAAAKLVDFLLNDPDAGAILLSDRGLPANTDVRAAVTDKFAETDKQAAEFLSSLEDEIVDGPVVPPAGAGQVTEITKRLNAEVLFGRMTPQQAAEQFVQEVEAAIS